MASRACHDHVAPCDDRIEETGYTNRQEAATSFSANQTASSARLAIDHPASLLRFATELGKNFTFSDIVFTVGLQFYSEVASRCSAAGLGTYIGASRGHIMDGVEESLRRLQMDHIDLYQIHANDAVTPVEETLRALDTLVQHGKVRYIGCSNWQAWKIAKALGISELKNQARFETVQAYYSIASRDLEREIIPLMESEKVGLLVWSPLAGGLLSGKFSRTNQKPADSRRSEFDFPVVDKERTWKILEVIAPIALAHGCSAARTSLAWLLAKAAVTSIIIGAKRLDQLSDNLAAVELKLSQDEIKRLDEVSTLPPEYPGWMLPFQGADRLDPTKARFGKPSDR